MTKSENGNKESKRLQKEVTELNNKLKNNDLELAEVFKNKLNIDINTIKCFEVAGGRVKHYDIYIIFKDETKKTIEHKGITGVNKVGNDERPWNLTPQLVNAPYNFSELSLMYCKLWWKCLPILKNYWSEILPEVPPYEEWIVDAKQGCAKTEWGKSLKEIRYSDNTNKNLIDEVVKQSLIQFWTKIRDERQDLLKSAEKTIENMLCKCINEKDFWLNAFYEKSTDIESKKKHWCITPKLSNLKCEICINENQYPKINLTYNLSSNPNKKFVGVALLRFGNGNGISNIRWNLS